MTSKIEKDLISGTTLYALQLLLLIFWFWMKMEIQSSKFLIFVLKLQILFAHKIIHRCKLFQNLFPTKKKKGRINIVVIQRHQAALAPESAYKKQRINLKIIVLAIKLRNDLKRLVLSNLPPLDSISPLTIRWYQQDHLVCAARFCDVFSE